VIGRCSSGITQLQRAFYTLRAVRIDASIHWRDRPNNVAFASAVEITRTRNA